MKEEDLSIKRIAELHREVMAQKKDLYTFLKKRLPDLSTKERLNVLAAVLNDHFDDYTFNQNDELKDGGYVIKRFFPKSG